MSCRTIGVQWSAGFFAAACALLFAAEASAADVAVTSAKIEAGRLLITGTTTTGGMQVRLDAQTIAGFTVVSNTSTRAYAFNLIYHPGDCIVALQKLTPPATLGAPTYAVVGNCGPRTIVPRGEWAATTNYLTNDLVTSLGSSWLAKSNNAGKFPPTQSTYWSKFVSKGDTGATGAAGAQGPKGATGATGPQGPIGATGPQGLRGLQGTQGVQGPAGSQGPQGQQGSQGLQGPAGQSGASGIIQTARLSGLPDPLSGSTSERIFIEPVAVVTITAAQRFTGFITVPVWSSGTVMIAANFCHKLEGTDILVPFGGNLADMSFQVTAPTVVAIASTIVPGQPGTYEVGLCASNSSGVTLNFDVLSGWIQVTN